jgi:hypothetical protein
MNNSLEGVVDVYRMNDNEICLKYKNPSFNFYELNYRGFGSPSRWSKENKLKSLPENIENLLCTISPMMNPVIDRIHNNPRTSFNGSSVYLIAYTPRFFHFMIEHLPKIFFLKEKDPNLKILLFSDEDKDTDGIFLGLKGKPKHGREEDGSSFKFWLDLLELDYRCFNLKDLESMNLDFEYAYVFYETPFMQEREGKDAYDSVMLNGSPVHIDEKEYFLSITLDRGSSDVDGETVNWMRPHMIKAVESRVRISDPNKKIYISRKNYSRVHPDENEIENYFLSNGYDSVCMEDLNPIEQIKLVRECTDIVCYLGSSIVNLYYARPNTKVTILATKEEREFLKGMSNYYSTLLKNNGIESDHVLISEIVEGDVFAAMEKITLDYHGI